MLPADAQFTYPTDPPAMPQRPDASALRILDAALNRGTEGLRVVEDYLRLVLSDAHLARQAKQLRHDLAAAAAMLPAVDRQAMRDTPGDVGTQIATAAEGHRTDAAHVAAASLRRTAEALRSLEEYGKLTDTTLASECQSLRYRLYTLEKATWLASDSARRLADVRLHVLVDGRSSPQQFDTLVRQLIDAGVGAIQLRDKQLDDRALHARAEQLRQLTSTCSTLALVNDRADIAAAVGADGVHLGQDDLPVAAARKVVGPRALVGVSTHHIRQARQAVLDGANYLGAGPTFPSTTKTFDHFPGLDYLRQVAAEISLPTFAIGGITADNLPEVLATGIGRVAVAGAITAAANAADEVEALLALLVDRQSIGESTATNLADGV